jgi:membrane protein YqaA with SNARE-associated domain
MNQNAAIWLLLVLAFAAANLPFFNERIFGMFALKGPKPFVVRVIELLVLYVLIGAVGFTFERMIGNVFAQRWEFYATTLTLFLVMAFPGFVLRYLLRR